MPTSTDTPFAIAIAALSFVSISSPGAGPGGGPTVNLWNIASTGVWSSDCERGRAAAAEIVQFMEQRSDTNVLASVTRDIFAAGRFEGVETGFFTEIAKAVIK